MATRGRKLPWISIHALRKESDMTILQHEIAGLFQSTLSVRRATWNLSQNSLLKCISIHALRKESDFVRFSSKGGEKYFNPRSP